MNAQALAERTLALCRIPSVIGDERALCDHVEAWARGHFAPEEIFRRSHSLVLGALQSAKPTVALVGHLDTVPVHPGDGPARLEGGRVYGLGSSDMKGGLAVMMALAESLPRAALPFNLVYILYEREEGPYLESGLGPLFESLPALSQVSFGIAMEPTDGVVQVGCVGSLQARVKFQGQSAHSARPWHGKNAIHLAGSLLVDLAARERVEVTQHGFTFYEVLNATLASGGRARNVIPDSFELNLNYRFAPGKGVPQAQAEVMAFVAGRAEVTFLDGAPSGRVCADNPLYKHLVSVTGLPAASKQAWTDVARFSELGVDAVNFGPGETAQAHQKDESAPVQALEDAYRALRRFLETPL